MRPVKERPALLCLGYGKHIKRNHHVSKETHKRDGQKRPTKETYTRDLQKRVRHTLWCVSFDLYMSLLTYLPYRCYFDVEFDPNTTHSTQLTLTQLTLHNSL